MDFHMIYYKYRVNESLCLSLPVLKSFIQLYRCNCLYTANLTWVQIETQSSIWNNFWSVTHQTWKWRIYVRMVYIYSYCNGNSPYLSISHSFIYIYILYFTLTSNRDTSFISLHQLWNYLSLCTCMKEKIMQINN